MELHEYPRPADDTGIGIHWVPGYATSIGLSRIREIWIPEMKSLGIKWVKIYNHDGAIDFAELLLAEGFMPIVRIYRSSPNPSRLSVKEIVHLDALLRAGVSYFEFNNEPDRDSEWKGGRVPTDGIDLVADTAIANMETVLERGGMPAIPAVSPASDWDLVGKIVQRGRRDLLDGPVWHAIHNYSHNRPLDYPYDIGNQEGAAYTQRFYEVVADENWEENAWRGRTLTEVNRLRLSRSRPGVTIMDDHDGWLAYEYFDQLHRRHLGRSIPILATESGYLIGEDIDPRFPATTPDLHMAQTLEACRIMMGTSQRFQAAPDYFFCCAFWLIANAQLGNNSTWWEGHAWHSDRWPGGTLPIVGALRAEPKVVRRWQNPEQVAAAITLHGTVLRAGEQRILALDIDGQEVARTELDPSNQFRFSGLPPGHYLLRVVDTAIIQPIELSAGQPEVVINLDLSVPEAAASSSIVSGKVRGGAGAVIVLLRVTDGEEWVTMARDDGSFRFVDLPTGSYHARVHPKGTRIDDITLDGSNQVEVELAADGWGYTVDSTAHEHPAGHGAIRCIAEGQSGAEVRISRSDWSGEAALIGEAPDFTAEWVALEPGDYELEVDGLSGEESVRESLDIRLQVAHRQMSVVQIVHIAAHTPTKASLSAISGHVVGELTPDRTLSVVLIDSQANRYEQVLDADGSFRFDDLESGSYAVAIANMEADTGQIEVAVDGTNEARVELFAPARLELQAEKSPGQSVISGLAPDASDRMATLTDTVGNEFTRLVDKNDRFRFEYLPAGSYTLRVEGGYEQTDLEVDGQDGIEVFFSPVLPTWEVEVSQAGSMPGFSAVRVEVIGRRDWPVRIWQQEGEDIMHTTGSDPGLGQYAVEFSPLGPGTYMVKPDDVDVWAEVELTGLEAVWVTFRSLVEPVSPNLVRPREIEPEEREPDSSEPAEAVVADQHFLYIASGIMDSAELARAMQFVSRNQPRIGYDLGEIGDARQVTVVGQVDQVVLDELRSSGVEVTLL